MHLLNGVAERWSVYFKEQVAANFYLIVVAHSYEVVVVGGVMEFAHGDPVGDGRDTSCRVRSDVGGIEEFRVPQTTDRALTRVREQYARAKNGLVQPCLDHRRPVSSHVSRITYSAPCKSLGFCDSNNKLLLVWLFVHEPHWIDRVVLALSHAEKPNAGELLGKRSP